jgi:hypothetical protein
VACLVVLFALLAPNTVGEITPITFVRIPVEGIIGVALVLLLPRPARTAVALLGGASLGVLTVGSFLDIGFGAVFSRPFDPLLDWTAFGDAFGFVSSSFGQAGAIVAAVAAATAALGAIAAVTLSAVRLSRLAVRYRARAWRTIAVLSVLWVTLAGVGVGASAGHPIAASDTVVAVGDRMRQVNSELQDRTEFAGKSATDQFRDTPEEGLLAGLRGKDVMVVFVESYGRTAVENPELIPHVAPALDDGNRRLQQAGFTTRTGYLTSSTAGGGSWRAHATLLSGLWINNERRYRQLVTTDRQTLIGAFRRAGWQSVGVMPGVSKNWPEAKFYGYDRLLTSKNLGYQGPSFGWSPMPDQYTLATFQRTVLSKKNRPAVMAEIPLTSSHAPWAPLPRFVDWKDVGDGSVYDPMPAAGDQKDDVWPDASRVRAAYGKSVAYSLQTLTSFVQTYGDDDLVLVVLGDHQPLPLVTGEGASRDVPISVIARDPAVIERIEGWGWDEGLVPGPDAPVWRMDTFRDRFLGAFGSTGTG